MPGSVDPFTAFEGSTYRRARPDTQSRPLAAVPRQRFVPSQPESSRMFDPITAQRAVTLEGRYALRSVLGQGRFATLFEAHDRELDHRVALRVVRSDECLDARDF